MRQVVALTWNGFLEAVRDRLVVISFFVGLGLVFLSLILGSMSFEEQRRLLLDFGMFAILLVSLVIAVFLGAYAVHKEVERQTCLLVLVRPVSRLQFILGKFFGILLLMAVMWGVLVVVLYALLGASYPLLGYILAALGILIESAVVLAFTMMCAGRVQPAVALFSGVSLFLLGHWQKDLFFFAERSKDAFFLTIAKVVPWVIPQFFRTNFRSSSLIDQNQLLDPFARGVIHLAFWLLLYLVLTANFFRRKDLV